MLCKSYCTHGGRCVLRAGHDGKHDSRYCQWTDAEALTRGQADAVLRQTAAGEDFLEILQPLADVIEDALDEQ